jgi:hypothetical protein
MWSLIGKGGNYYFWERNPVGIETSTVYQTTQEHKPPEGGAGYYNLTELRKRLNVQRIVNMHGRV